MYRLTEAAASDIEEMLERSLLDFGEKRTQTYYDALARCLALLGANPEMGVTAEDIRPGYRRFAHESHVVFYTIDDEGVLIVRVLHKRMDATRHLPE